MTIATIKNVLIEVDDILTKEIYALINAGDASLCKCAYCRNFVKQVPDIFPQEVVEFFRLAGIDYSKDAEIYQMGKNSNGLYQYGGEFYFIAKDKVPLESIFLENGFQIDFTLPSPIIPKEFRNFQKVGCFSFMHEIPWVLSENP